MRCCRPVPGKAPHHNSKSRAEVCTVNRKGDECLLAPTCFSDSAIVLAVSNSGVLEWSPCCSQGDGIATKYIQSSTQVSRLYTLATLCNDSLTHTDSLSNFR